MEYFPLALQERVFLTQKNRPDGTEEVLKRIRDYYKNEFIYEPHLFCHGDYLDDDILYEFCINPDLRILGDWVMRKLVLSKGISWNTMQVRLRIATNVLTNMILKKGSRNLKICIQDNMVNNVWAIHRARLIIELPFYQG